MWGPNCRFDFHRGPWINGGGHRERCHGPPGNGHHDFLWHFHGHHKDQHGHHFRPHGHHGHCHGPHGHPYNHHGPGHKHGHRNHGHHHESGKHFGPRSSGPWERRECRKEFRRNWFLHGTEERRTRGCQKKDETVLVRGVVIERPHSV